MPQNIEPHSQLLGHNFQHEHAKKDLLTETITETTYVTASPTNLAVVVWVDSNGNVVSTETRFDTATVSFIAPAPENTPSFAEAPTPTNLASTTAAPSTQSSSVAPPSASTIPTPTPAPATTEASSLLPVASNSSVAANPSAKSVPEVGASPSAGGSKHGGNSDHEQGFGLGIAYDILDDQGNCKSADTVEGDFDILSSGGYSIVRIYEITCNQVQLVTAEAAKRGMTVMAGISNEHLTTDLVVAIDSLIAQAGSNLGVIDTIAIGNEYVADNGLASDVVAALGVARAALNGIFSGSIVTVDTIGAHEANTQLCGASDYCAANCHAYFANGVAPADAGSWVQGQANSVAAAHPGKKVVITESGWPWKNTAWGNTWATEANQAAAISSLRDAFSSNLILFQAFDTLYKPQGDGTEWYFGIYYHYD